MSVADGKDGYGYEECQSSSNSYCMDQCLVTGAWALTTRGQGDGLEGVFDVPSFVLRRVRTVNVRLLGLGSQKMKAQGMKKRKRQMDVVSSHLWRAI